MMRIDATYDGIIRLRDVFKPIIIENEEGDQIRVKIIDGGFEVEHKKNVLVTEKVEE